MKAAIPMQDSGQQPPAAPAAPAAASPYYTPPPPPYNPNAGGMNTDAGIMEDGGAVDTPKASGFKKFFSDIDILSVFLSMGIVAVSAYAIKYYRFMIKLEKTGYADLNSRVIKLESAVSEAKKSSEMNATGNKMTRRKRAVVTL
jgi:hypothetical protein